MCGIVAIQQCSDENVSFELLEALLNLQHRGQDASGIMTYHNGQIFSRKKNGLVLSRYSKENLMRLKGRIGLGHVRYQTAGKRINDEICGKEEIQPFYSSLPYGMMLAHNGTISQTEHLVEFLKKNYRHINSASDSDMLINLFAYVMLQLLRNKNNVFNSICKTVYQIYNMCKGAYSVVIYIVGFGLVAFKDPYGIRPLVYGYRTVGSPTVGSPTVGSPTVGSSTVGSPTSDRDYMIASESVALDILNYKLIDEVAAGQVICITEQGQCMRKQISAASSLRPCIFEYVYLARPDSIINGVSVYKARQNMGRKIAESMIYFECLPQKIDLVIPVPETARPCAIELAKCLQVEYGEGIIKNQFSSRTFIARDNNIRKQYMKRKFNVLRSKIEGKNVIVVDDSIVRGNVSKYIVKSLRDAGANRVYFVSCSPPLRHPNIYGIDIGSKKELIADESNAYKICKLIGADGLIYMDQTDLEDAVRECNNELGRFETSVFDGKYI